MSLLPIIASLGRQSTGGTGGTGGGTGGGTPINSNWGSRYSVFYGDSITWHAAATDAAHGFVNLLKIACNGVDEVNVFNNQGQPGWSITPEIANFTTNTVGNGIFDPSIIETYDSGIKVYCFICYGMNDQTYINAGDFGVDRYQAAVEHAVDVAVTKGWPLSKIVVMTPPYGTRTDITETIKTSVAAAAIAAATAKHCVGIDLFTPFKNSPNLATMENSDGVHPNDSGHVFIKDTIMAADFTPR